MANKIRGKNEGSIFRRKNGSWRAQISIDGRRISYSAKTKTECQRWLRKMQLQIDQGWHYDSGQIFLEEYLEQWLNAHQTTLRDRTIYRYKLLIKNHITPHIGQVKLVDLHLSRIERYYGKLKNLGVGTRTIREVHAVVHQALKKAVRYGYIHTNPAQGASVPRYTHAEMQILDESQVTHFLVAAQNSRHMALYQLAVVTGMRQGELFGLKWADLKWSKGVLHVKRQVQSIPKQGWKFVEPKTKAGRRTITLGNGTLQSLREHQTQQQIAKALAGERWQEYDLIFPSSVGTPLNTSNLRVDFLQTLEAAGIEKLRFHDLRHTAASLMLNHGVPVIVVSKILGHAKVSTTLDTYGHLINEMQDGAAQIMDELVTPIPVNFARKTQDNPFGKTSASSQLHQSAPDNHNTP